MRIDRRRSAWIAGTLLGLLTAACGQSTRDTTAMPEPPAASPPPGVSPVVNDPGCELQYTAPEVSMLTGTDPFLGVQWHLANDGTVAGLAGQDLRVVPAWQTTKGEKVRVAVIDRAIEVTHEDLLPNVVAGASYSYRDANRGTPWPLPCRLSDSHGTAVAGLVTARDANQKGVAGVAPRAELVGYNALVTSDQADIVDALSRGLESNAIYNNSWGSLDDRLLHPASQSFIAAIENGIAKGRNDKGAIYVFSAGNGGCELKAPDANGIERCVPDNSNYDGYVNKLGVIAVCAVTATGVQPSYGERGANLLVCGPSSNGAEDRVAAKAAITTTTVQNKYTDAFTGTSASTPMVSGVVALMLAVNPELTWRDVRLILASTARQNDLPPPGSSAPDPGWTSNFGLRFSHKYGFGVANAEAAVTAARTWTSVGDSSSLIKCGPYTRSVNAALPDPADATVSPIPATSAIDVPPCSIDKIEFVEVRFTAAHALSGQLQVRLRSPRGLVSELADPRLCPNSSGKEASCGSYNNYAFGSVRHMDEPVNFPANSNWSLEVADTVSGTSGTFGSWSITFFGRSS